MNKKTLVGAVALVSSASATWLVACSDDALYSEPEPRRGGSAPEGAPDGSVFDAGDAAPRPQHLLLSMNNTSTSELVAFNLRTNQVDGRLTYPGFIGTTFTAGDAPFLLQQAADVVAKLDALEPWKVRSTWNVRLTDQPDGGDNYSDPVAAIVAGAGKGYVLRYTRNAIAVIDTNQVADGGAPTKTIDLASLLQPEDGDGIVEMTGGVFVPSKNRVYVLLGNLDRRRVSSDGFTILCTTAAPTLIAIDPTTDSVVSLGGTGPGGGIKLLGYNPPLGIPLTYDAAQDRLLVMHAGCNEPAGDGGAGPVTRRQVEQISLATGAVQTLLNLNASPYPLSFTMAGAGRAIVGFFGEARVWDMTSTSLGAAIVGAPDGFAYDGKGNLIGPRAITTDAGKSYVVQVTSMSGGDAGDADAGAHQIISQNPFTDPSGFIGGVEMWPRP